MMHFTNNNSVKLLRSGAEYFPALEQAIDQAKVEIYLQTYIYQADETGIRIGNALKNAALRGVAVNVLLDGFGSKDLSSEYIDELQKNRVKVMFYRPKISPWTLQKRRLIRMHRKVAVIDGAIGFVGGINIIDDNNTPDQIPPRIDYAVQLEGPILLDMIDSVHKLWHRMSWMAKRKNTPKPTLELPEVESNDGIKAAFVIRSNVLHRHDIERAYLQAIHHATSEIMIANAYFLPSKRFRKALLAAAARGVKVKLLLQGRQEYILMFATYALYSYFLNAGIEVYEYRKSFLHSKVAVVDSDWATVGSSNIDPLSLMLANEANVVIQDRQFASELRAEIEQTIANSEQVTQETWKHHGVFKHCFSWIMYRVVKISLGILVDRNEKS